MGKELNKRKTIDMDRPRQTDRQTDGQTDRQANRDRQTQAGTQTETDRQTDTELQVFSFVSSAYAMIYNPPNACSLFSYFRDDFYKPLSQVATYTE